MALFDTASDHTIGTEGTLVAPEDPDRRYIAIQNKHLTIRLCLHLLPKGHTTPLRPGSDCIEIAPGELWVRQGEVCPANAIYLASSSRSVVALVDIQTSSGVGQGSINTTPV